MDRRRLIRTISSAVIAGGLAGCQGSDSSSTPTGAPDPTATATVATTTSASSPSPSPSPPPDTPVTPTPTPAPLAGEAPTDIDEHVANRARVVREFLPDTSSSSLAVALPTSDTDRKLAYCFDAVNCYLRYAWQGEFLSVSWTKEDGPAEILGDRYYTAATDQVLQFGTPPSPPETREFHGHSVWDGYPTFHYELDGVGVDHRIASADGGPDLEHRFELEGVDSAAYFVADEAADYEASAGEWIGGTLEVPPDAAGSFTVTVGVSQ